jgi:regulator of sirC expression with transglutaminase-like and TPR domain
MLESITAAIIFDPLNADYFRVRGYYNLEFKRWERALSDLTRATELRPKYADAIQGRVTALIELGCYDEAWTDVGNLNEIGWPVDATKLDRLRKLSGRDGNDAQQKEKSK